MGYYTDSERMSYDNAGTRTVRWLKDAPPQKDVPHAGALVRLEDYDEPYKVMNGIPFKKYKGACGVVWVITVQCSGDPDVTHTVDAVLNDITPWVTDDEPCYTEEQIREACGKITTTADTIVNRLKKCDE